MVQAMELDKKSILVLARRDHIEAMRVAAGLTIFGHRVRLVFMTKPVSKEAVESEQAELLELSDISPETTVPETANGLPLLDRARLRDALGNCDGVICI